MNPFEPIGLTDDDIISIIVYREPFSKLLKEMQQNYRIRRAMEEDDGDKLLIATRVIDEIINQIPTEEWWKTEKQKRKEKEEFDKLLTKDGQ